MLHSTVPPEIQRPLLVTNIITTNQATLPDLDNSLPIDLPSGFLQSGVWLALAGQIIMIHVNLNVRIDCEIRRGSPTPDLSWWKSAERVKNSSKIEVYRNGSLLIKDATKAVEGVYTCEARTSGLQVDRINTSVSIIGKLSTDWYLNVELLLCELKLHTLCVPKLNISILKDFRRFQHPKFFTS